MPDPHKAERDSHAAQTEAALLTVYIAARADVMKRLSLSGDTINIWRRVWRDAAEAAAGGSIKDTAAAIGNKVSKAFEPKGVEAYLDAIARNFADRWSEGISESLADISGAMDATYAELEAEVLKLMEQVIEAADLDARELTSTTVNFADLEAAEIEGMTTKTWHTSSGDSRSTHAALNGTTIPLGERFPNGLRYPKAPGPPQETVNCECYLTFGR